MQSLFEKTLNTRQVLPNSYRYIRSDVPTQLTDRDIEWLKENRVTRVVDLREPEASKVKHCRLEEEEGFIYVHMPVTVGMQVPPTQEDVPIAYGMMLDDNMKKILEYIEASPENVLFFCNAGKDRTGVVSALLQKRAGLDREYIVDNYAQSADNLRQMLKEFVDSHEGLDINVVTPRREYMEKFLDIADKIKIL